MLKSMTAYGRASLETTLGRFVAEVQSVNRKFLEIAVHMPKELLRYDSEIRKLVSAAVERGQVTLRLNVAFEGVTPLEVSPNLPLARQLKTAWQLIAQELSLNEEVTLDILSKQEDIILYTDNFYVEEKYSEMIKEVCQKAIEHLVAMKLREGIEIEKDIRARLEKLAASIEAIAELSGGATEKYRQKLMTRLEEVLGSSGSLVGISKLDNQDLLMREVALFAEKIDIAEEIVRYRSHLKQFEHLLSSSSKGVGKPLEFLLQELHREINTIGSKSADARISHSVIEMKSLQEQIREQIQNIE
jgi:uncharacterized protein (TIGR00255 family)